MFNTIKYIEKIYSLILNVMPHVNSRAARRKHYSKICLGNFKIMIRKDYGNFEIYLEGVEIFRDRLKPLMTTALS
jgi:hypothetical protein